MCSPKFFNKIIFLFVLYEITFFCKSQVAADNNDKFILDNLDLTKYDINERPRANDENPVQINVSIYVQDLEWKHNEMIITMFLTQKWTDDRLTFIGESPILVRYNQLKNKIWTPDTFIIEAVSKEITEYGTIKIYPNGQVTWLQTVTVYIPCSFDFDSAWETDGSVECSMDMESYGFTTKGITYAWNERNAVGVAKGTKNKTYAKFSSWEKELKLVEAPSGNYGRLSVMFKFATVYTKEVLRYLGTKAMQNY